MQVKLFKKNWPLHQIAPVFPCPVALLPTVSFMVSLWSKQSKHKSESVSSTTASVSVIIVMDLEITESKPNILVVLKSYLDFFNIFLSKGKQLELALITK